MHTRSLATLVKALKAFGVTDARLETFEAVYHDYTQDMIDDPIVDDLFGDVSDDREDQGDRRVCTSPAHVRVYAGHVYMAFTTDGQYIRSYGPSDGGVLPLHIPEEV